MTYTVNYYNVNGPTTQCSLNATTERGAKAEATKLADGTITQMHLYLNESPVAWRESIDTFRGCGYGWKPWQAR